MKVQDFAYQVVVHTMDILEHEQHYKISEEHRKAVMQKILSQVDDIIKKASK